MARSIDSEASVGLARLDYCCECFYEIYESKVVAKDDRWRRASESTENVGSIAIAVSSHLQ